MNNYLLKDYKLSGFEVLQSLIVSEYGLRHLAQAKIQPQHQWGHRVIAVIELCPLIGLVATIIEAIAARYIRTTWVFRGSQIGCEGRVPTSKVEAVRARLEKQHPLGIHFNKSKVSSHIEGGTCTAMALEFVSSYFKIKKACATSEMLLGRIAQIGRAFAASSETMKIRQAAYNTIEVKKPVGKVDISRNKVQALANDYGLAIKGSSEEVDLEKAGAENELASEMRDLPDGAHFLRVLKPANNERLEEHGHSLIYIKEQGVSLFYDPNFGVKDLAALDHSAVLFKDLKECFATFQVHKARFYRLY